MHYIDPETGIALNEDDRTLLGRPDMAICPTDEARELIGHVQVLRRLAVHNAALSPGGDAEHNPEHQARLLGGMLVVLATYATPPFEAAQIDEILGDL